MGVSLGRAKRRENRFPNSRLSSSTEDQARPFSNINELLSTFTQINKSLRESGGSVNRNVAGWPPRALCRLWFILSLCLRGNMGNSPVSGNYPGRAMLGKDPRGCELSLHFYLSTHACIWRERNPVWLHRTLSYSPTHLLEVPWSVPCSTVFLQN